jgi:hypothetical protein
MTVRANTRRPFGSALPAGWVGLLIGLLVAFVNSATAAPGGTTADFYVAANGNDQWSGQRAQLNFARTDGPFATLARARDAVRTLKAGASRKDFVVRLRGGTYRLDESVVFSLADSAPDGGTITYAAYGNEQPILGSAVPILNWQKLRIAPAHLPAAAHGRVWVADLPTEFTRVLTLYDGPDRLPRARGEGFAPADFPDKKTWPDKLAFPTNALRNWPDLQQGELVVIPQADYEISILPLAAVDEAAGVATTTVPASRPIGRVKFVPISVWVENVLAVIDQPGEWVVNSKERKIYLWPRGRSPGRNIVAPQLTELVRVEGEIDAAAQRDEPVRGLVFHGLTFQHAERYAWHGYTGWGLQHHWEMFDRPTAALRFRGAEACVVQACRFTASSGSGIRLDLHCQKNRIVDNEISHLGGVGILLAGYGPGTKNVNRQNEIRNNWIHHTGEIYWATPAVMIWQSGENHIANNLIHDTPYSAITVTTRSSWNVAKPDADRTVRWAEMDHKFPGDWYAREPFMHARQNLVEHNDIHDVMQMMGDGNAIYLSGTGGGNVVRRNYLHDCDSDGMADAIRCDDDQNEVTIESNVIARTRVIGFGICSKGRNHIINNLIVDLIPTRRPIRPERVKRGYIGLVVNPVTGSRIERNVLVARTNDMPVYVQNRVYGRGGEPLLRECQADRNLYFCATDPTWGVKHLEQERPFGVELNSRAVDPHLMNLAKGDLRLQPNSPALALGFEPIDLSRVGLLPNHSWRH